MPPPLHVKEDVELMVDNLRRSPTCIHPDALMDPTLSGYRAKSANHVRQQRWDVLKQKHDALPTGSLSELKTTTSKSTSSTDISSSATSEADYIRALNYTVSQTSIEMNVQQSKEIQIGKNKDDFIFTFDINQYTSATTVKPTYLPTQAPSKDGVTEKEKQRKKEEDTFFNSLAEFVSPYEDARSSTITSMPTESPLISNVVIAGIREDENKSKKSKKEEETEIFKNQIKKYADDYNVDILSDDQIILVKSTSAAIIGTEASAVTKSATLPSVPTSAIPKSSTSASDTDADYVLAADSTSYPTPLPSLDNDPDYVLAADSTSYPTPTP